MVEIDATIYLWEITRMILSADLMPFNNDNNFHDLFLCVLYLSLISQNWVKYCIVIHD